MLLKRGAGFKVSITILDVDGTLVDSNYQHVLAWHRAFRSHGVVLELWRIHRHIGMGGDQLVSALAGEHVEREHGDEIRAAARDAYMQMIDEVEPVRHAKELLVELDRRGHTVMLASSAKQEELDRHMGLLDIRELVAGWASAADVVATKPASDLLDVALDRSGADVSDAVMIGDSPWDVMAAQSAGMPTLAVMTGGFSREELLQAGASDVFESVATLCEMLDETILGGAVTPAGFAKNQTTDV